MTPAAALKRLGLAKGADVAAIRKAYAALFKAMDVDADPEGYARLRQARDVALRAAKLAAAPPPALAEEPEAAEEAAAEPAAPWLYAAPAVTLPGVGEVPLLIAGHVPHPEAAAAAPQLAQVPDTSDAARRALAGPPVIHRTGPVRADVGYLARPDVDLARLLHDAEADLAPLDDAGAAFALRCLDALLAEAASANLTRHGQIEDWLADLLADTWPRSAPLLRPAAEAFGWENERGQINERPSIGWLNMRLRGLRFQDKVAEPDHPLHKAWAELTRPGSATLIDKFRIKRADINQLLEGVRKHFPELEHHFARERVVSWGDGAAGGVGGGFGIFRIRGTGLTFNGGYAISVVVGLQVLMAVLRGLSPDPVVPPANVFAPPPAYLSSRDPHFQKVRAAAVEEVFGKGKTIAWLLEKDPGLSGDFDRQIMQAMLQKKADAEAIDGSIELLRNRAALAGLVAEGAILRDLARLRLAQTDVVRKEGGSEACNRFLRSGDFGGVTMPESVRVQERAVAMELVSDGSSKRPLPAGKRETSIPGALVGQVIKATGLPDDRVRAALQDKATPSERCTVIRALLAATLKWKGKEQGDILRVM